MKKSLIYHAGALGDFITTLPAMAAWKRLHQADRIALLGRPELATLAPEGLFDEVWDAGSAFFSALFGDSSDLPRSLSAALSGLGSALLFAAASSRLSQRLAGRGVGEIVRQDPFPAETIPIVDYHLGLFPDLALVERDRRPRIRTEDARPSTAGNTVAIHPGSGDRRKNWPFDRFVSLAERLANDGMAVRWAIGPAEEGVKLPSGSQAWRGASLRELASELGACRLFVGNDSGISHLAAAVGCPTVALFGPTDPGVWAPRGPSVRILRQKSLEALTMETVFSVCRELLRR